MQRITHNLAIINITDNYGYLFLRKKAFVSRKKMNSSMKKNSIIEVAVKVIVAALTAFLTAITTTSCMGYGPIAL